MGGRGIRLVGSDDYLKLDLTDALGNFKWSVFEGNLSKGQNIVYLDWNSVDASKTYLVVPCKEK
ncbi:hypothetical protein AGMMS49938_14340 [Fibrobacterales bacterium]|nr:hypothetical protein AGMMS49938_14340 [Fibrobacterales bacterium]